MTTLVKSNGFPLLRTMMDDFWNTDRLFNQPLFSHEMPAVNVIENKDHYEVEVAAPGFNKDDFKVSLENGMLTISAENSTEEKEEKRDYTRREFSHSSFSRTFTLPENVEENHIKAKYHDGLLAIELKKSGKKLSEGKQIKIE
jgi:HSP20 family protein